MGFLSLHIEKVWRGPPAIGLGSVPRKVRGRLVSLTSTKHLVVHLMLAFIGSFDMPSSIVRSPGDHTPVHTPKPRARNSRSLPSVTATPLGATKTHGSLASLERRLSSDLQLSLASFPLSSLPLEVEVCIRI